jgi:prepilin-type N-terminal cleavage/methylation domain-containing protein
MSRRPCEQGFSLIELAIVLTVMGVLFAIGIPAVKTYSQSGVLRGAAENIAGQIQLCRARAMSTGNAQTLRFVQDSSGFGDYHLQGGGTGAKWDLPNGVTYAAGSASSFTLTADGRSNASGFVVLQNRRGDQDTVSVQISGLVLVR